MPKSSLRKAASLVSVSSRRHSLSLACSLEEFAALGKLYP